MCSGPRIIRLFSLALAALMLWQYGGGRTYAALSQVQFHGSPHKETDPPIPKEMTENRFDALLVELREVIRDDGAKTKAEPAKGFAGIERLNVLKDKLATEDEKNQEYFLQLEKTIAEKKLPDEIRERHAEFVRQYQSKYDALITHLEGLESAHKTATGMWGKLSGQSKSVNWAQVIEGTTAFLDANTPQPRPRQRFDRNNLPHRSLKADKPIAPKLTRDEWLMAFPKEATTGPKSGPSAEAKTGDTLAALATAPPVPADLAETIEVKFTPGIRQLAESLDRNPVKIYNWVRNNIEFVPIWGSIQGAQLCLETKSCNAFDTSSLLLSLLRYSGIPSRYQLGTIEVPIEKFKNWAGGFTNAEAAASLFASGGVPSVVRRVNENGQVVTVRLEHLWVKAFVDYAPSSGAMRGQGDTWVDADPSFKQHSFPAPVDLSRFVRVGDAHAFRNQTLASATVNENTGELANMDLGLIQSTLQPDEAAIFDYLSTNFAQKSVREMIGEGSIITTESPILAARLPYGVLASGVGFSDIPSALRHSLEVTVTDPAGGQPLRYTESLPALAGARLSLSYAPASEADRQAVAALAPSSPQQSIADTIPATFINLRPELKANGQTVSLGSSARLGATQIFRLNFTSPNVSTPAVSNTIVAGESFALGLDLQQQVSPGSLSDLSDRFRQIAAEVNANPSNPNISPAEIERLLLGGIISGWFRQVDLLNRITARLMGVVSLRYPSAGMAFADLETDTLFGAPRQVTFAGLKMDIDRDVVVTLARDGALASVTHHSLVMGMLGSGLEASAPAQFLHRFGETNEFWISTTSALAAAQSLGGTTVALTPANFPLVASRLHGLTPEERGEIEDTLNAGMIVMLHERPLADRSSRFQGYIQLDPQSGSGAYIIAGTGGSDPLSCLDVSPNASGLARGIGQGAFFDVFGAFVQWFVDKLGGPGRLATGLIDFNNIINSLDQNSTIYTEAVARLGPSARPLMGLVVLLAALDALKSIAGLVGAVATPVGVAVGAYLNIVSWTAFRMAEILINRLIETEAAAQGQQFKSGCLILP